MHVIILIIIAIIFAFLTVLSCFVEPEGKQFSMYGLLWDPITFIAMTILTLIALIPTVEFDKEYLPKAKIEIQQIEEKESKLNLILEKSKDLNEWEKIQIEDELEENSQKLKELNDYVEDCEKYMIKTQ